MDPLAEKYIGISSYAYVGNNPLIRIDPDGRDIYEINAKGVVTWKEESDIHQLYFVNERGQRGASITVKNKDILDQLATDRPETKKGRNHHYFDYFKDGVRYAETGDRDDVFSVFYFAANNTKVEWALDGYKENGRNEYILATGHNDKYAPHTFTDYMPERDLKTQFFSIHSHQPHNSLGGGPWAGDKDVWRWKESKLNGREPAKHYVYEVKEKNLYWYKGYRGQKGVTRKINKSSDLFRGLGF